MKSALWVSRLLFLLIAALPFQLVAAAPPTASSDSGTLVITQDGSVKLQSELNSADSELSVNPFVSTDNGTLTVGSIQFICSPSGLRIEIGYGTGAFGSYSPAGLTGGNTVINAISDIVPINCNTPPFSTLVVSGFSSNPGSGWLSSITCNGVNNTGSSASFSYTNGTAAWNWDPSKQFGFGSKPIGSNVSCSIIHN